MSTDMPPDQPRPDRPKPGSEPREYSSPHRVQNDQNGGGRHYRRRHQRCRQPRDRDRDRNGIVNRRKDQVLADAPARPEWVANPSNEGLTRSELATELYQQEGYRNVVEAGECTCELRFPSWDNVTEAMETEFAGISRFEFLEVIPDIRKATKTYRNEGRPICRDAGLW